jgi:signal peptidase II
MQIGHGEARRNIALVESAIVAVVVVLVDQITKFAIIRSFEIGHYSPLFGNVVRLTHIRNSGAVFGILRGAGTYFTLFSIVAAGILVIVLFVSRKSPLSVKVGLGLVLGGAVGNLIDRLRMGEVIDFVDIGITESVRWPSFNVADLAITVGVVLLAVKILGMRTSRASG